MGRLSVWEGQDRPRHLRQTTEPCNGTRLKMRVIKAHHEPEMSISIFGTELTAPVMGAPMSGVKTNLNDAMPEEEFYWGLLKGAQAFGTIGMVGNTPYKSRRLGGRHCGEEPRVGNPVL